MKASAWRERVSGVWSNRRGYTLKKTSDDKAWRLSDPQGQFIADQLDLFRCDTPMTTWADEILRGRVKT